MKSVWILNQYANIPETGPGNRHFHFAKELARKGHNVTLVFARKTHLTSDAYDTSSIPLVSNRDGFRVVCLDIANYKSASDKKRIIAWFHFAWKLSRLNKLISGKPDVVLCSSPSLIAYLGGESLARKFNAKLIFEVRDIWPLTLMEIGGYSKINPLIWLMQRIEDRAYQKADFVLSNLPNAVQHMVKRGMSSGKFHWISNGFSKNEVSNDNPLPAHVDSQLPPPSKFIVGYTGTVGTANELENLLIAAKLLKDYRDIAFVIVGKGNELDYLKKVQKKEALRNLFFVDPVDKKLVPKILSRFDICYLGLKNSPLFRFGVSPNKLFEYLEAGKPIVYAIDSGNYRPVETYRAGENIPPGDPKALAQAVLKIYNMSEEQRLIMGENGRRAAMENHEYGKLAERLEKILAS